MILRTAHTVAVTALALTGLCGCGNASYRVASASPNQAAPDFTAQSLDGHQVTLSSLRGRVVILFLWAAWECSDELAALDDIAARSTPQNMSVVAVSIDRNSDIVEKIARTRSRWNLALLHEPTADVARRYNPRGFPAAYVIDASGTIRHAYDRVRRQELHAIEAQTQELMAKE